MSEKVAVLGPAGTFSEEAARRLHPKAELVYLDDVGKVFEYVKSGRGKGVVAIENSLEGSVGKTMECLMEYDVHIIAELALDIELCIAARPGVKKDGIKRVLSHPHALAQCQKYFSLNYPDVVQVNCTSTSSAMEAVLDGGKDAAIGASHAAEEYGLSILDRGVQDSDSKTRFIELSREEGWGRKTSIIFAVKDEPGALYSILKIFADEKINLTKIESRPSRRKLGEYVFYVDFENGGLDRKGVDRILLKVKERTTFLKNLGSY